MRRRNIAAKLAQRGTVLAYYLTPRVSNPEDRHDKFDWAFAEQTRLRALVGKFVARTTYVHRPRWSYSVVGYRVVESTLLIRLDGDIFSKTIDRNWYTQVSLLSRINVSHLLTTNEFCASRVICYLLSALLNFCNPEIVLSD